MLVRGMSFRLAAYAVCVEDGRVLLARHVPPMGESSWTLPGGQVEHGEDPFDAVIREVVEETGCDAVVERLLGVDSRVIPAATARARVEHQNVGIFYRVRITGGQLRPEPNGEIVRVRLDPDPRCRLPAPVIARRRRPAPGTDRSGDRPRRSRPCRRLDPALRPDHRVRASHCTGRSPDASLFAHSNLLYTMRSAVK
ncbi:NUDIX hydrolase [Pseudonocardia yunnanensis]|uniref:NUDIX hydrolase n=1 Tax=Pseudonocardia yunnanensis TaxID=58107 RepID=A0ABW4EVG0_9PSEU